MTVTDIRIKLVNSERELKALASITLDDTLVIHNIRIIDGKNGLFLAFPSKRLSTGAFFDLVHPIKSEFRDYVTSKVLAAYEDALEEEN